MHTEIYHGYDANNQVVTDILALNKKDVILEIGVGTGTCAKRIAPMVRLCVGIDKASHTVGALKKHVTEHNVRFYCFDMCDDMVPSELRGRFTKAYSFDTLEHVKHPELFFKNLAAMLTPDGEVIIVFPNESPARMHGITSFRTLNDLLDLLPNTSLKVINIYKIQRSFLFNNLNKWLWKPITKVGKFVIAPSRNRRPQCFDDTVFFRFIANPSKLNKLLNIYARFLIKIASIRPIFHYIPLMGEKNLEIQDCHVLLHLKLQKC